MPSDSIFSERQPTAEELRMVREESLRAKAERENRVAAMVHQELARQDLEHRFDPYDIARGLLEDPQGQGAQALKTIMADEPPDAGWTKPDIDLLGRAKETRELSPSGRRRDMHLRNRELLNALMSPGASDQQKNFAAWNWNDQKGRTHGTSGWIGATQNPEYAVGAALQHFFQPASDAAYFQWSGQEPPSIEDRVAERFNGPMAKIGGVVRRFITQHYPAALDLARARAAANAVERVIPAGMTRKEGNRAIERLALKGDGPTFDEMWRLKYGKYPSYALSTLATFGNGMLDPSLLATGPAAKAATTFGKLLMGAGKAGLGSGGLGGAALRGLYHYGKSVAKDAAPLARAPVLKAALKEGAEETPTNAGIMAALAQWPKSVYEAFTDGNEFRRDLYVQAKDQRGEPIFDSSGKPDMRKQSQEEFLRTLYDNPHLETTRDPVTDVVVPAGTPVHGPNSRMRAAQVRREIPGMMHQIDETLGKNRKPGWPAITPAPSSTTGAIWQNLFTPSPDKLLPVQ